MHDQLIKSAFLKVFHSPSLAPAKLKDARRQVFQLVTTGYQTACRGHNSPTPEVPLPWPSDINCPHHKIKIVLGIKTFSE
jgi:hypothetical protein